MAVAVIGAVVAVGLAGAALLSIYTDNITEKRESEMAKSIVNNASYLQGLLTLSGSNDRGFLLNTKRIPVSSMIVKDHEHTEAEINAFSKQFDAILVLLNENPNLEDTEMSCALLTSTNLISHEECELIKDKKFKTYSMQSNSLNYDISSNSQKIQQYAKKIQANQLNMSDGQLSIFEQDGNNRFEVPLVFQESSASVNLVYSKEVEYKTEVENLIASGMLIQASAKLRKLIAISKDSSLVVDVSNTLSKRINAIEEDGNMTAAEIEELDITKANLIATLVLVAKKEAEAGGDITALIANVSDIQKAIDFDLSLNSYVNSYLSEEFTKYF